MTEARMQEAPTYAPGTFCWVELGTTDSEAAKKFYTSLFDWEFTDMPMDPGMVYTILKLDGKDAAALYKLMPEQTSQGVPPHWLSYVSVKNADESTAKAKELGATALKEAFDVYDVGRMSVIQDPTGAVFALWQPGTSQGVKVTNVPNSFCWNELATPDTTKAGDFYAGLFGWGKQTNDMGGGMLYTMFANGERPAGGMYKPTPEMGPIPPNWLVYFAVDDADAKAKKASDQGATIIIPPSDIPGVGRFSVIQDPQGATFGIIKLTNPPPA